MAKKKNSRKALAVALGIMGIAGLSIASASQLTVNPSPANVAVGSGTFAAACDTAVDVSYTFDIATGKYTNLVIGDIAAACSGKSVTYTLKSNAATPATIVTGTVSVPATTAPALATVTVPINTVNLTTGLGAIDVSIY
jgi:hypothetical protein